MTRQAQQLGLSRSSVDHIPQTLPARDLALIRRMGIAALFRRPRGSVSARGTAIYRYLLAGLGIAQPHQVWAAQIIFLAMANSFLYLAAIIDDARRQVLAFRLSNTMSVALGVEALEQVLERFGRPELFNTDQGARFTSDEWPKVLKDDGGATSMEGKGRLVGNLVVMRLWRNFKYETAYLHACTNGT